MTVELEQETELYKSQSQIQVRKVAIRVRLLDIIGKLQQISPGLSVPQ